MYSIGFPKIFNGSTVYLNKDYDAIKTNLQLLLGANKGGLFGDPAYGTKIKTLLYEQVQSPMIPELIKDDIFEAIYSYMPQIDIKRDDIQINIVDNYVQAIINVKSDSSVESNLYTIDLLGDE